MTVDKRRVKKSYYGSLGYFPFERGYGGSLIIKRQVRGLPTAAAAALAIPLLNAAVMVFTLSGVTI